MMTENCIVALAILISVITDLGNNTATKKNLKKLKITLHFFITTAASIHNADFEKANFVWTYGIYKVPVAFFWYSLIPQIISELPKNIHSKLQIFSGTNHFFASFIE